MIKVDCRNGRTQSRKKPDSFLEFLSFVLDFDRKTYEPPSVVNCRNKKPRKAGKRQYVSHAHQTELPGKLLRQALVRIVILVLALGLNWTGLSAIGDTIAFFFDSEKATDNLFEAAILDFDLNSLDVVVLSDFSSANSNYPVSVEDDDSVEFQYNVESDSFVGALCDHLNLKGELDGVEQYSGPLVGFSAGPFAYSAPEDWDFMTSLADNDNHAGTSCAFDFVFSGWQVEFPIPFSGFHDQERISNLVELASQCDALSIGYWRNHDGCSQGAGSSDWTSQVNGLSTSEFSSAFGAYTGAQICSALWIPNCGPANQLAGKICRARAHTLADELNLVSGRLDLAALIDGADDGNTAFDNLGLTSTSTVGEALAAIELILVDGFATAAQLTDAAYVAARIYNFYENENPIAPQCILGVNDIPEADSVGDKSQKSDKGAKPPKDEGESESGGGRVVLNEVVPNPPGEDNQEGLAGEWIEVQNEGDEDVDLNGWSIEIGTNITEIDRQVITASSTETNETVLGAEGDEDDSLVIFINGALLDNESDTISLFDGTDELEIRLTYDGLDKVESPLLSAFDGEEEIEELLEEDPRASKEENQAPEEDTDVVDGDTEGKEEEAAVEAVGKTEDPADLTGIDENAEMVHPEEDALEDPVEEEEDGFSTDLPTDDGEESVQGGSVSGGELPANLPVPTESSDPGDEEIIIEE